MEKNKEELYLKIYMILITSLLLVRDLVGIGFNKYIFLAIASLFMAIVPIETMIYMLVFTFPLFCGLPAAHIRLVAIVLYLLKKKKLTLGQAILSTFVIIWEFIAAMWYPSFSMGDILGYLSAPVMLFLFLWDKDMSLNIHYKRCLSLFMIGFSVVCIVIIGTAIIKSPSNWMTSFAQGLFRASITETDKNAEGVTIKMNANVLAYYCCVCVAVSLCLIKNNALVGQKKHINDYIFTAFFTIIGIFSLSRTFILVIAIVYALYIVSSMNTLKGTVFAIMGSAVLIGGSYIALRLMPSLTESIYGRFSNINTNTAGGRTELFTAYMEIWMNNERFKWLGTGVVEYRTLTNLWNSMHNGTQQILVCMGIPGFIVFVYGLATPIIREIKDHRPVFFYAIPLFTVILFIQSIQFLNPTILLFPFIIGYFSLKLFNESSSLHNGG